MGMHVHTARVILAKSGGVPGGRLGGVRKGLARRAVNVILHYAEASFNDLELMVRVAGMLEGRKPKWPDRDEVVRYIIQARSGGGGSQWQEKISRSSPGA